ncbi:hypothetical protein ACFQZ4_25775 [Catellatospora coxensis]
MATLLDATRDAVAVALGIGRRRRRVDVEHDETGVRTGLPGQQHGEALAQHASVLELADGVVELLP